MARFFRPIALAMAVASLAGFGLVPAAFASSAAAAPVSGAGHGGGTGGGYGRCSAGTARFTHVLRSIQREYGGGSITEPELEAAFQRALPVQSHACHAELSEFFTQWFDTAYPAASGATKPAITGPGLAGPGFSC